MIKALALAASIVLLPIQTSAMEFIERKCDGALLAKGEVELQDVADLRLILKEREAEDNPVKVVYMDSPGGSFLSAILMTEEMVKRDISVRVDSKSNCISACAYMLIASKDAQIQVSEDMRARVKIHYPFVNIYTQMFHRETLQGEYDAWMAEREVDIHYMMGRWLTSAQVPSEIAYQMFKNRGAWFAVGQQMIDTYPFFKERMKLVEEMQQCSD